MNQPPPGRWQWVPATPPQRASTAFIRHWYEWLLFTSSIAAFALIVALLLVQAAGGWRW